MRPRGGAHSPLSPRVLAVPFIIPQRNGEEEEGREKRHSAFSFSTLPFSLLSFLFSAFPSPPVPPSLPRAELALRSHISTQS